jgi:hypothetical protein
MIPFAAYMPVMLAVMEIPGCLIALMIVARLRRTGMDVNGNMADEAGYNSTAVGVVLDRPHQLSHEHGHGEEVRQETVVVREQKYFSATAATVTHTTTSIGGGTEGADGRKLEKAEDFEDDMALQSHGEAGEASIAPSHSTSLLSAELLHEVLLNPGIYLLFAGILIGFVSALQGPKVTKPDDLLFVDLLHPILCLFLLEMGMTASSKLKDLRYAGWQFVAFALIAPNIFATTGMCITHAYSMFLGQPFQVGTYALFAVLCGAASYIALPAVQRMAIPEASPTLPLAASLGCTFSYNVTIGIPIYILIAKVLIQTFPVVQAAGAAAGAH